MNPIGDGQFQSDYSLSRVTFMYVVLTRTLKETIITLCEEFLVCTDREN